MPKVAKELGPLAVSRLVAKGIYPVGRVRGLYLRVTSEKSRSWILRVQVGDKRREIGLGPFPEISLKDAHARAQAQRDLIQTGVDPVVERQAAKSRLKASREREMTFLEAARQCMAEKSHGWANAKHGDQWKQTLETYAYPLLGKMLVRHIDFHHVLAVLKPIWTEKTETASRLRGRIEAILDWSRVSGYRDDGVNPAAWRGNLEHRLAAPNDIRTVEHHPALAYTEMFEFMRRLRAIDTNGAKCLDFAILTAARSGEARGALWTEIDEEAKVWRVPAHRMKKKREHRVPLSPAALDLLSRMPRSPASDVIFPSPRDKVLSDMSLLAIVRRMGVDAVPHGFRSTFRVWAAEMTAYPAELAEFALAHVNRDKTEAAYQRKDLLERRRRMMSDWAEYIAAPPAAGVVIPMQRQDQFAA